MGLPAAKDAVRSLLGVVGVSDDISVKPKASMSALKSEIEAALKRRANVWAATQSCWRESRGSPRSSWAKERANDDALQCRGGREFVGGRQPHRNLTRISRGNCAENRRVVWKLLKVLVEREGLEP